MKVKKTILLAILVLAVLFTNGQCKYTKKGVIKFLNKRFTTSIHTMTRSYSIFSKLSNSASGAFMINENNEYYFVINLLRSYSSKFEILEGNKLVIGFENNIDLQLTSSENVESKNAGISLNHFIWAIYKVNKEQLGIFAENPIFNVKIYFVSEKEIANTFEDDDGTFFEFEILSEKKKSNLIEPANCILQIE